MTKKVNWISSKCDLIINLEKYNSKENILFITGLVGSGKSTLAKELEKKYNATVIIQDFLAWSDCYNCEECTFFTNLFQEKFPETKEYFINNEWRQNTLTKEQKIYYRQAFDQMIVDYAKDHNNSLFIYEGSDLFCKSDINLFKNKPIIIKRTSVITSFIRNFKRGNKNNNNLKMKLNYLKRMTKEFNQFYIQDLPKLNNFIDLF